MERVSTFRPGLSPVSPRSITETAKVGLQYRGDSCFQSSCSGSRENKKVRLQERVEFVACRQVYLQQSDRVDKFQLLNMHDLF